MKNWNSLAAEERGELPSRRIYEDPADQEIVDRRDRLDELHRQKSALDARRWWLWAGVALPVLYLVPALWLEQRLDEIRETGGAIGMMLLVLCPIVSGAWLGLDHRKRRVTELRIAAEEGALREQSNFAYWPPSGNDKSRLYDRATREDWYPRSKSRSV